MWSYRAEQGNKELEEAEKSKWDAVGFDICASVSDDFDPNAVEPMFVKSKVAYYDGVVWGNQELPSQDQRYDMFVENPITGWALDGKSSPVLNADMTSSAQWADGAKAIFGFEVKNLSGNVRFYLRKHYIASAENTDGDYITDWIFVNTPSLYTTSYTSYILD